MKGNVREITRRMENLKLSNIIKYVESFLSISLIMNIDIKLFPLPKSEGKNFDVYDYDYRMNDDVKN